MPSTEELSPTRTRPFAEVVRSDGGRLPRAGGAAHTATPLASVERGGRPSFAASLAANLNIVGRRTRVTSFLPGTSVGAMYDAHEQSQNSESDATSHRTLRNGTGRLPPVAGRRATVPGASAPAVSGVALLDDPYQIVPMRRATLPTVASTQSSWGRERANKSYVDWYDRPDNIDDSSTHTPITGSLDRGKNSVASYYLFSQFGKDPSEFHEETSGHSTAPTARTLSLGTSYDYFIPAEEPSDSNKTVSQPAASVSKAPTGRKVEGTSRYEWNSFVGDPRAPTADDDNTSIGALVDAAAPPHTTALSVFRRTILRNRLTGHTKPGSTESPRASYRAGVTEGHGDSQAGITPPLHRVPRLAPGTWSYVARFARKLREAREAKLRELGVAPSVFRRGRTGSENDVASEEDEETEVEVSLSGIYDEDGRPMMEPTMSMLFSMNMSDDEDNSDVSDDESVEVMHGFNFQNAPSILPVTRRQEHERRPSPSASPAPPRLPISTAPPPQYPQTPARRPFQRPNMEAAFYQQQLQQRRRNNMPMGYIPFTHNVPPPNPQPNIFGPPLWGRKPPPADFGRIYGWRLSDANWVDSPRGGA